MSIIKARDMLVHLRLHFQLLLAPVFLWGWLLAGGGLSAPVVVAFIALHVFLYGGVTAFNSYFDRDVGPVGGLERPPPVPESLLGFSVGMQAIGLALCALVNLSLTLVYLVFVMLSTAYSHPRIRWKARPLTSLVVVGFGQGVLAFAAAWSAVRGSLDGIWGRDGVLGALSALVLILALYPLTQLYQIDEDRRRGDRTIAVVWGARRCFLFSVGATLLGGALMLLEVTQRFGPVDSAIISVGLVVQAALVLRMAREFGRLDVLATYRRVMRLNRLSAAALGGYLLARLSLS
jgi:4-hydroxybenzoate polyprenyltransferase